MFTVFVYRAHVSGYGELSMKIAKKTSREITATRKDWDDSLAVVRQIDNVGACACVIGTAIRRTLHVGIEDVGVAAASQIRVNSPNQRKPPVYWYTDSPAVTAAIEEFDRARISKDYTVPEFPFTFTLRRSC